MFCRLAAFVVNDDLKEVTVDGENMVRLTPIEYNILLLSDEGMQGKSIFD